VENTSWTGADGFKALAYGAISLRMKLETTFAYRPLLDGTDYFSILIEYFGPFLVSDSRVGNGMAAFRHMNLSHRFLWQILAPTPMARSFS
jgi:hypothetical protein